MSAGNYLDDELKPFSRELGAGLDSQPGNVATGAGCQNLSSPKTLAEAVFLAET
jgi:hypothetical protein